MQSLSEGMRGYSVSASSSREESRTLRDHVINNRDQVRDREYPLVFRDSYFLDFVGL